MSVPSNLVPTSISQLPTAGPITGTELVMIVQNGVSVRTTTAGVVSGTSVPSSRLIATGTGLAGGGDLSADRTLYIANTGVTSGTYGTSTQVPILTVNAQGQITNISTTAFTVDFASITGKPTTLAGYGITDAQPLNVNLTAFAGLGTDGLVVKTGSGSATTRTITAGTAITVTNGDGISGDPTIALSNTAVTPGIFGSATQSPVLDIDQQGRITSSGQITITPAWSSITSTPTTLAGYGITDAVPNTREVNTTKSLSGGGPLTANLTLELVNDVTSPGGAYFYGTDVSGTKGWFSLAAFGGGTVTSIDVSGGTTGLTTTGGPITTSGAITIGGTLNVASGGTGANTLTGYVKGTGTAALTASSTIPNTDITGLGTMSTQNANSVAITGGTATLSSVTLTNGTISATPSNGTDIANKDYVDSVAAGLNFHQACNYATTADLGTVLYSNGTGGVGATLTNAGTQATLVIDGHTFTNTDVINAVRILVKNQSNAAYNGVYVLTNEGSISTNWSMIRATDFDTPGTGAGQIDAGDFFLILSGSANANTSWVQQTPQPITVGTTGLVFTQFAAPVSYSAGTGLNLVGNTFNISNTTVAANTYGSSTAIPSFTVNAQGQLTVAADNAVIAPAGTLTGTTLASNVVSSSLTSVGTIGTGVWQGTAIGFAYGGTGLTSTPLSGEIDIGNGAGFTRTTLTQGFGITITNGAGSITIANAGVTSFEGGTTGLTPATSTTGSITLGGTLVAANGGTGQSSYAVGDILYASTTTALSKLGAGTVNYALVSNGAGVAPSYQQISLTAGVTGTLPIANGGTGQTSASAAFNALSPITATGDLIIGNGVNSATNLAIGANGYVLTSNGTTASWQAATGVTTIDFGTTGLTPATPTGGAVTVAGTLAIANGGTGATTISGAQTNLQVDPAGTAVAMAIALG